MRLQPFLASWYWQKQLLASWTIIISRKCTRHSCNSSKGVELHVAFGAVTPAVSKQTSILLRHVRTFGPFFFLSLLPSEQGEGYWWHGKLSYSSSMDTSSSELMNISLSIALTLKHARVDGLAIANYRWELLSVDTNCWILSFSWASFSQ
jgi:hypothetical protein